MNFLRIVILISIFFGNSSQRNAPPPPDSVLIPVNDTLMLVDSTGYYMDASDLYKRYHIELTVIKKKNSREVDRQINRIKSKKRDTVFIISDTVFNSRIEIIQPAPFIENPKKKGFFNRIFKKRKRN